MDYILELCITHTEMTEFFYKKQTISKQPTLLFLFFIALYCGCYMTECEAIDWSFVQVVLFS